MERQTISIDALDGSVVNLPDGRSVLLTFTGEVDVAGGDDTVSYTYHGFNIESNNDYDNRNLIVNI